MPIHPFPETPVVAFPNLGGLDTTSAPAQVARHRLVQLDNGIFGERKTWKKRGGLVEQSSTSLPSSPVRKLIDYWRAGTLGTPTQKHVAVCGASIFRDDGDNVWDDITGSFSVPSTAVVTHAVVGDVLVLATEATIPVAYNQTGNVSSLSGTPPAGTVVSEHLNRCWMNSYTDPHRLYFTGPTASGGADPTRWSIANGGGSLFIEEDDGDPAGITSMWKHMGNLYVSKLTKIYRIEGRNANTFRPVLVSDGIGCAAPNGVVPVGTDVFFPSLVGFHSLAVVEQTGGLARETLISNLIHTTFQSELGLAGSKRIQGVFYPEINSIVWSVPLLGQTTNSLALVYSLTTKEWSKFTNFQANALMGRYNSSTKKIELWTGGDSGKVFKYTPGTLKDYGSTSISMRLKSGHIYPDKTFSHMFNFRYFNLLLYPKGSNHTVTLTYKIDSQKDSNNSLISNTKTETQAAAGAYVPMGSSFIMGTHLMGEDVFTQPLTFELKGEGRAFEWQLVTGGLDEDLEIAGWYLEVDPQATWRDRV